VGKVEAVTYRNGSAYFRINGIEVPFSDVSAIGEEGSLADDGNGNG